MSEKLIQYAYVSGEISPALYGRSDLEKYDLGLSLMRNWITDYRGGMFTRAGTQYTDWLQHPEFNIKFVPFEFSPNVANTNFIIFGSGYIRFAQEGQYVLEDDVTVNTIVADVFSATGNPFVNGDLIKLTWIDNAPELLNRTFEVFDVSGATFRLRDQFGITVSASAPSSATANRAFTLSSPYLPEDLPELKFEQVRDFIRLTHYKYQTRDLVRLDANSWSLDITDFDSQVNRPGSLTSAPSAIAAAGAAYAVTAVDHNGAESLPSDTHLRRDMVDFTVTSGNLALTWSPVPGADYYNVYRSTVSSDGTRVTRAMQLGFLGRAYGAQFLDTNIIPNFTVQPPRHNNPFADRSILWIDVTAPGAGYDHNTTLSVTDPSGTGFIGYPVVNDAGGISGVIVLTGGSGYVNPSVVLSNGGGATFAFEISGAGDRYPATSAVFQQRQAYAGAIGAPLTIWASKPRRFNNFDVSPIVVDSDSYEFEIDAQKVSTIRHLVPMRGGLLIMNDVGVWQLSGGSQLAVTPTNALAEPQSYTGVSNLSPIKIETDLLYTEAKGYTIRLLGYNDLAKLYAGTDISVLSGHLFGLDKEPISWAYAAEPYKLINAIRVDGYRLIGTLMKEQNVFAWGLASTRGFYKQVVTIQEDNRDRVYFDVARKINGKTVRYIELEARREVVRVEDQWALDCALALPNTYPAATLTLSSGAEDVNILFTVSVNTFAAPDVGKVIFAGTGKALVTSYVNPTQIRCTIIRAFTDYIPETKTVRDYLSGEWTLDTPVTTIANLHHLEGEVVSVLADGSVIPSQEVVNGAITLPQPATKVIVGIPFRAVARTLPLTASGAVIEDRRKRIVAAATRLFESRGLKAGARLDQLYDMKERTTEPYGEPTRFQDGMRQAVIEPEYSDDGQIYYVVEDPLYVTILGHVLSAEIGDDTN